MSIESVCLPAGQSAPALFRHVKSFFASFLWALEVHHRIENAAARGGRLDGDTIRRIIREADEGTARA